MIKSYNIGEGSSMSTTRKTITITSKQDTWIKQQIAEGGFTNDSEYIRDLIRQDQAKKTNLEAIRAALIEGEESGEAEPFNTEDFKKEMIAKHGKSQ